MWLLVCRGAGGPRQPDRDGFMGKMLWAGLEHQFNEQFNGFARVWFR